MPGLSSTQLGPGIEVEAVTEVTAGKFGLLNGSKSIFVELFASTTLTPLKTPVAVCSKSTEVVGSMLVTTACSSSVAVGRI